ncbi:hypothetical protein HDV00_009278 [Rhizophlyctis rosea]|nr:hypothetical protein HDV00_009278 [Rhizophlyctis rosea]
MDTQENDSAAPSTAPTNAPPTPKRVKDSKTTMTQMVRPSHVDSRGFAFGGQILAWIDVSAGVAAKRHAGRSAVTASVDAVHFFESIKLGELCVIRATVNKAWRTSMEVGVRVEAEDIFTGRRRYCCHAYLTFVAIMQWMEYALNFKHPTRIGDTIIIRSVVSEAFSRSLETYVTVEIETPEGSNIITNDGFMTMVAVDQGGNKIEVPKVQPVSSEDHERQIGAAERRQLRLAERDQLRETLHLLSA